MRLVEHARQLLQFQFFFGQASSVRAWQLRLLLLQPAMALLELFDLAFGMAKAVFVDLARLLVLGQRALRVAYRELRRAQGFFFLRQMAVGRLTRGQFGLLQSRLQGRLLRGPFEMRADGCVAARDLRFVAQAALFDQFAQTLARRILVLHALFDARDFGLRLIVSRLLHIQRVLPGEVHLTRALQRGFDLA